MPVAASRSAGCHGSAFVPMRRKVCSAKIARPIPTAISKPPSTSRVGRSTSWLGKKGIGQIRSNARPRTSAISAITGGGAITPALSRSAIIVVRLAQSADETADFLRAGEKTSLRVPSNDPSARPDPSQRPHKSPPGLPQGKPSRTFQPVERRNLGTAPIIRDRLARAARDAPAPRSTGSRSAELPAA